MPHPAETAYRTNRWLIAFLIWTGIGLAFGTNFYLSTSGMGGNLTWSRAVMLGLKDWYIWALLSPGIWWVAERYRIERSQWQRSLVVHLLAGLCCSFLYEAIKTFISYAWPEVFGPGAGPFPMFGARRGRLVELGYWARLSREVTRRTFFDLVTYLTLVLFHHALNYYRRLQEREKAELELKSSLAEARIQSLKMQLQPHFLFNTLNAISTLIYKSPKSADEMIFSLSSLLRATLDLADRQELTLREEIDLIDRYLSIEQVRFGDRLAVRKEIGSELLDAMVPAMILQPLVENAVRHGIEPSMEPGTLVIRAWREGEMLRLTVQDNGVGLSRTKTDGIGLNNTRARLQQLYGARWDLSLTDAPGRGALVQLNLPWHEDKIPARISSVSFPSRES